MTLAAERPDEARALLPQELKAALPALVDDAADRVAPADVETLTSALSRTLALGIGGPMSDAERQEWQICMVAELQDIPADLALEALKHARRTCTRASEILPAVIEYVEDYPARRRARLRQLITLADVVGVDID